MDENKIKGIIEGLLFVSGDDGLTIKQLSEVMGVPDWTIELMMGQLKEEYSKESRGLMIMKSQDVFHLTTKPIYSSYFKRLLETPRHTRLSQAALETLAIIAYKQPITRVEIDDIRGVNSDRAIQTLVARSLIEEQGRKETVGRPILYGTTKDFLTYFGLTSIGELPAFPETIETDLEREADLFFDKFNELESN